MRFGHHRFLQKMCVDLSRSVSLPRPDKLPWYNLAMNTHFAFISRLSNKQLLAELKLHAQHECEATAALIAHLAIFDERRLYLDEGCSSTFSYCVEILHLSEAATGKRIAVARAARMYPVILELLADGSVNLTTVLLLAPHFTPENHVRLLTSTKHKSKRQVEEFVVALRPLPPVTSVIRKLPTPRIAAVDTADAPADQTALPPAGGATNNDEPLVETVLMPMPIPVRTSPSRRSIVQPLAPDRFKVEFTASADTREKLQRAQDLLRHQIPDGSLDKVMNKALTTLLEKLVKQKMAETDKPRHADSSNPPKRGSLSRHIPAHVRRKV